MRFWKIAGLVLVISGLGMAAAYGTGILGLFLPGQSPAIWPATVPYKRIPGAPQPIPWRPLPEELDESEHEIFEAQNVPGVSFLPNGVWQDIRKKPATQEELPFGAYGT